MTINELTVHKNVVNLFKRHGIFTVHQLSVYSKIGLSYFPRLDKNQWAELITKLNDTGIVVEERNGDDIAMGRTMLKWDLLEEQRLSREKFREGRMCPDLVLY